MAQVVRLRRFLWWHMPWRQYLSQAGVKYEGASTAGIISTIEPITTIILGGLFLGEVIGVMQYIGVILILAGVTAVEIAK